MADDDALASKRMRQRAMSVGAPPRRPSREGVGVLLQSEAAGPGDELSSFLLGTASATATAVHAASAAASEEVEAAMAAAARSGTPSLPTAQQHQLSTPSTSAPSCSTSSSRSS